MPLGHSAATENLGVGEGEGRRPPLHLLFLPPRLSPLRCLPSPRLPLALAVAVAGVIRPAPRCSSSSAPEIRHRRLPPLGNPSAVGERVEVVTYDAL
uniref:Uncharacterized protein n=1 Tax=Leersia perrieri TaxID=77586 RepID=A0A0D9WQ34_9ORYZ